MFAQGSPPAGRSHLNCFAAERRRIIRGSIDAVWMFYMVCVDVSGSKWPQTPQFVCQSAVPTIGSGFIFVFIFFTPRCAAYTCVFIHFKQHFVFNIGHPALLLWPLIQQNYHTDRLLLVCLVFFLSEPDKIFFICLTAQCAVLYLIFQRTVLLSQNCNTTAHPGVCRATPLLFPCRAINEMKLLKCSVFLAN